MRFSLSEPEIIQPVTGALNLRYFNTKKGSYWSEKEKQLLQQHALIYGVTEFKNIRNHEVVSKNDPTITEKPLGNWSEHEIRLRVCKMLKVYNLEPYRNRKFCSKEEILAEAQNNLEMATQKG